NLMARLNLKYPLIVAPMAGGPSSVDLVAESSRAGALGSVGAAYFSAPEIQKFVEQVRNKTEAPIAVNLFCPHPITSVSEDKIATAIEATKKYREELGLPKPSLTLPYEENFDAQFKKVMELRPAVLSFAFGLLDSSYVNEARGLGIFVIGTATSLE